MEKLRAARSGMSPYRELAWQAEFLGLLKRRQSATRTFLAQSVISFMEFPQVGFTGIFKKWLDCIWRIVVGA
jgi:hypothetical protein